MDLTWYGGRVYDVVHLNIIFEEQLKDVGALDLPCAMLRLMTFISTFWRELDTLLMHFRTTLGWSVMVATMLNETSTRTCWTPKVASGSLSPFGTAGPEGYGLEN